MLTCYVAVQWAGQLGDGRAISLGQAIGPDGVPYELQLKVGFHTFYLKVRAAHSCLFIRFSCRFLSLSLQNSQHSCFSQLHCCQISP